jgi:prevent-host-death family protein
MVMESTALATPRKSAAHRSGSWTVADAKARLSEVIERAQTDPQIITRHGKPSVVVVSAEEWARKTERRGSLAEFLLGSPLRGAELDLERLRDQPHDLDL